VNGASHGVNYRRAQCTDDAKRAIEIPSQQFNPLCFCNDMLRQSRIGVVVNYLIAKELAQPRIRGIEDKRDEDKRDEDKRERIRGRG